MQKTTIEWTATYHPDGSITPGYSSNPIYAIRKSDGKRGWACTHASPGCLHCYSETINKRLGTGFPFAKKYEDGVEWRLNVKELATWFRHKAPGKCFVADMTDLFHPAIPEAYKLAIIGAAALTPWKTYQFLTKRAAEMAAFVEEHTLVDCVTALYTATDESPMLAKRFPLNAERVTVAMQQGWPPKNTWWGVSVESPEYLRRVAELCKIPAAVRWVSAEPLLAELDFSQVKSGSDPDLSCWDQYISWVVFGGESGPGARPCNIAHIRSGLRQCQAASIKAFVKQWGSFPVMDEQEWRGLSRARLLNARLHKRAPEGTVPILLDDRKGGDIAEFPLDLQIREFPA